MKIREMILDYSSQLRQAGFKSQASHAINLADELMELEKTSGIALAAAAADDDSSGPPADDDTKPADGSSDSSGDNSRTAMAQLLEGIEGMEQRVASLEGGGEPEVDPADISEARVRLAAVIERAAALGPEGQELVARAAGALKELE